MDTSAWIETLRTSGDPAVRAQVSAAHDSHYDQLATLRKSTRVLDLAGSAPDFPYPDEPPPAEPGPDLE